MNLYEFEGKRLFNKHRIHVPKGAVVYRGDSIGTVYENIGIKDVVVKAQVLSGKRGKNNAIRFCSNKNEVIDACDELFSVNVHGQYVAAIRIEEKLDIIEEHYLSITYNTFTKQPVLVYSKRGGIDIEDVPDNEIVKYELDIRKTEIDLNIPYAKELYQCFINEDARLVEINPLVKTLDNKWIAADSKIALDDDAAFRHEEWKNLQPRAILGRLPTEREVAVRKIDKGEAWYRGTAGKYIEMEGNMAILFSGGGASIANMDALIKAGLTPANYTEYSGNPPREKVYALAKIVLSKPNLKGLWIAGGVANFTNIQETFNGIVDALDEIKPSYPIVVRRAGPHEEEGMKLMEECAKRNNLNIKLFGKDVSMSESAKTLAAMV